MLQEERQQMTAEQSRIDYIERHKGLAAQSQSILKGDTAQLVKDIEQNRITFEQAQVMITDAEVSGIIPKIKANQMREATALLTPTEPTAKAQKVELTPIEELRADSLRWSEVARGYEGGKGLAVGAEGIRYRWKSDIRLEIADYIEKQGLSVDEAVAKAKKTGRQWIAKHNAQRPKDINWKRWEGSIDSDIETVARKLRKSMAETPTEPTAKGEGGVEGKVGIEEQAREGTDFNRSQVMELANDLESLPETIERYAEQFKYRPEHRTIYRKHKNTKPEDTITVYRGVSTKDPSKGLIAGDWVALNREYAEIQAGETGRIIEQQVKAKDVSWAGTDLNEWYYTPTEPTAKAQKVEAKYDKKEFWSYRLQSTSNKANEFLRDNIDVEKMETAFGEILTGKELMDGVGDYEGMMVYPLNDGNYYTLGNNFDIEQKPQGKWRQWLVKVPDESKINFYKEFESLKPTAKAQKVESDYGKDNILITAAEYEAAKKALAETEVPAEKPEAVEGPKTEEGIIQIGDRAFELGEKVEY
jgi:hypothetical protein